MNYISLFQPNFLSDEDLYKEDDDEEEEDDDYIPESKPTRKISLLKKGSGKTKTLREIKVEKAEMRKKEQKQAKQQLINEDDMSDPLQSASFKRFSKLLDIIFEHEDEMVPESFKLGRFLAHIVILNQIKSKRNRLQ